MGMSCISWKNLCYLWPLLPCNNNGVRAPGTSPVGPGLLCRLCIIDVLVISCFLSRASDQAWSRLRSNPIGGQAVHCQLK